MLLTVSMFRYGSLKNFKYACHQLLYVTEPKLFSKWVNSALLLYLNCWPITEVKLVVLTHDKLNKYCAFLGYTTVKKNLIWGQQERKHSMKRHDIIQTTFYTNIFTLLINTMNSVWIISNTVSGMEGAALLKMRVSVWVMTVWGWFAMNNGQITCSPAANHRKCTLSMNH